MPLGEGGIFQPSAAKWNILGTNDASFNDGTGIAGLYKNLLTVDSNPYKFRASRNAAANTGNAAYAVIAFDTEQYDTNSNLSAGVYTAPVNGFYHFDGAANVNAGAGGTVVLAIFVNGVETSRGNQTTIGNQIISATVSDTIQLSATNTVDLRVYGAATYAINAGNTYHNFFSGFLVSRT